MVNRKLFVFLIVVMFIVGIGYVSAQNIDENGTSSSSNIANDVICLDDNSEVDIIDSVENDVSTSSVEEERISDSESTQEVNSWADLKSKIENASVDTVKLNASNIAPSTSRSNQISLNHDITIVGGEGYYIGSASWNSAPKYNYIPMITSGNNLNVKFENVTFQYLSNNIFIKLMGNGNYTFKNCVFNHINATGDHQSVIWLNYGHALIENCNFTNCKSSFGAITNYYSSIPNTANYARMTVKNSTFKDNYATTEPGAINNCGQLVVYDSTFENNEAFWWAGAIHTHSYANTTIVNSTFKDNKARWNGGALYTYSYLTVINSTFISNIAEGVVSGGAIAGSNYGSNPQVLINNSTFMYNLANKTGGAISIWDAGYLKVYNSLFINNTENNHLNAISYSYSGNSPTAAYLIYINNTFVGPNNASGSVTYGNNYLNVTNYSNIFIDSGVYNEPQENNTNTTNDTNSSTNFISIPDGTTRGSQLWNASLDGALGGTPLINGDYIYVTNGHNVYCYNINTGALLWNVSSQWGYFHELALHNDVIIAPCAWDKLYFINSTTGALIQNESNIYPGSSIYAPLVVGDMIYISSEYAYDDAWIAVIEYVNGQYVYEGNILEIYNVPYGEQGLLSQPVVDSNGNIWVNTVDGLVRIDPYTYDYDVILNGTYGKPVVYYDVIYTLAYDNRIYRIMDNYIDYSDVVTGGLGNSLVFSDYYYVLFFVTDDGGLNVLSYDLYPYGSFQLNPTSSNIASIDGVLYIGDDAGILWVIDASLQDNPILWAYDAGAGILGTPVIADGVVYVGNNETFYALSDVVSRNLIVTNVKSFNALKTSKSSDILSSTNDEEFLTDSFNHVYVSVNGTGDGSSADNPTSLVNAITANIADNTIIHIADGNYEVTSPVTIKSKENITIMADNHGKVNISYKNNNRKVYLTLQSINNFTVMGINFNYTYTLMTFNAVSTGSGANNRMIFSTNILIDKCNFDGNGINYNAIFTSVNPSRNLTISDCNFSNSNARFLSISTNLADYSQQMVSYVSGDCVVNISNCIFNNCSTDALYLADVKDRTNSPDSIIKHYITNCKFYNTSLTIGVGNQVKTESIFEIKDCIFDIDEGPSIKNTGQSNTYGGIFTFENNNISSDYAIQLGANSKVISPLTFRILNNASVKVPVNESVDIIGELVDDKNNRIYHAGLKLDVNGSEESPSINPNSGLYLLSFTPENMGNLPVEVDCNLLDDLSEDIFYLTVSGNPNLTVNCNDSIYGEPFNVNVTLNEAVSGENVTFSIVDSNGNVVKSTNSKINNAFATASFEYVPVGDYTVSVTYDGDDNFGATTITKTFTISKANSTVQILIDPTIPVGDNITVQAIVPANAGGNVTFRLNTDNKTVNVTDKAVFDGLANGTYIIYAVYNGDDNYNPSEEVNVTFEVVKVNPTINIEYSTPVINENVTVTVTMDKDINGDVNVTINKLDPVVEHVVNGTLVFNITNVPYGPQNITVSFTGNDKYNAGEKNISFFVNKLDLDLSISADAITYGEPLVVMVTANEKFTGEVTVKIGNLTRTANVVNGKGNATFNNLSADDYFITATFTEDETFYSDSANTTVTVNGVEVPVDQALDINVPANSQSPTFSITLYPDATGNFTVSVDGVVVDTRELVNGSASITVKDLAVGNHNVSVSYSGDGKYAPITQNTTLSISKIATGISASKVTAVYLTSNKLVVTLKDKAGNILTGMKVTVKVGSISKTLTTDSKGQVSVDVSKLVPKTYTAKFTFAGDDKYLKSEGSASVKINKAASKITAKKKTFKAKKKTKKYTITLKSGKKAIGKVKVTIKIGKKTYTAKTNKKGKATFNLKKLTKKGKYNAVIKFKGNKYYKATTKKVKIVLK